MTFKKWDQLFVNERETQMEWQEELSRNICPNLPLLISLPTHLLSHAICSPSFSLSNHYDIYFQNFCCFISLLDIQVCARLLSLSWKVTLVHSRAGHVLLGDLSTFTLTSFIPPDSDHVRTLSVLWPGLQVLVARSWTLIVTVPYNSPLPGRGTVQNEPLEGIHDPWKPCGHLGRGMMLDSAWNENGRQGCCY